MKKKSIGIFAMKVNDHSSWDPTTVKSGITGSEEAIIYISQKLAELGYQVTVFADPPPGSIHSAPNANPRYVEAGTPVETLLDIAITWRVPQLAKDLRKIARKVYLWPHDVWNSRLSDEQIDVFDDVLWLSLWHRRQWVSINPRFAKFTKIFGNGINPEQLYPVEKRENPYSCIYSSNYARGLEILLDIWPGIKQQYPAATLSVYYGWQHWGLLAPAKEEYMRKKISLLPDVVDYGLVGHDELNRAFAKASFWTYPCILPETFCITAIRAQLAGAIPVILDGSALPETVRHGYRCAKREQYFSTLMKAMWNVEKFTLEDRKRMGEFVVEEYSWKKMAARWKELFEAAC